MSTVPLSGVNSRFSSVIPRSRFSLKMSRLFCVFRVGEKCALYALFSVNELRCLGNQLPVLGKANSLCNILQFCVFCLFVNLRLRADRVGLGIKLSQVIVGRAKCVLRLADVLQYQLRPLAVGNNTNSRFLRIFVLPVPLFR